MDARTVEDYLHKHIPISQAMGVTVDSISTDRVVLKAGLAANINHRDTVFGGSASSVAILAAWTLVYTRLLEMGLDARLVIQESQMHYDHPIADDFVAICELGEGSAWSRFIRALKGHGRGRLELASFLKCTDQVMARFHGRFVAVSRDKS